MKWKLWLINLGPFNNEETSLVAEGGAVGVDYLILITEAFYSCNVFTDKLTKYGLCKCSEVDWKLADRPGREDCDKQDKVQLEASAIPQVSEVGPVLFTPS